MAVICLTGHMREDSGHAQRSYSISTQCLWTQRKWVGESGSRAKNNGRPDSFEPLDARAALPQNCSIATLFRSKIPENSTGVLYATTKVPYFNLL